LQIVYGNRDAFEDPFDDDVLADDTLESADDQAGLSDFEELTHDNEP
jgi:hypothetical protein